MPSRDPLRPPHVSATLAQPIRFVLVPRHYATFIDTTVDVLTNITIANHLSPKFGSAVSGTFEGILDNFNTDDAKRSVYDVPRDAAYVTFTLGPVDGASLR